MRYTNAERSSRQRTTGSTSLHFRERRRLLWFRHAAVVLALSFCKPVGSCEATHIFHSSPMPVSFVAGSEDRFLLDLMAQLGMKLQSSCEPAFQRSRAAFHLSKACAAGLRLRCCPVVRCRSPTKLLLSLTRLVSRWRTCCKLRYSTGVNGGSRGKMVKQWLSFCFVFPPG